ncbi:hypothetical protein MMC25_008141 [Agyrium rufum]|nr:hypothetical protein [Agyrium rufum]
MNNNNSPLCAPPCPASDLEGPFKGDEGYADESERQESDGVGDEHSKMALDDLHDSVTSMPLHSLTGISEVVMAMSEEQRSEYVFNVIRTLRTSYIATIVDRLTPFLHIDPVAVLPPEITSDIFSYLSPEMLTEASRVSHAWRERILESHLWRNKFLEEGWTINTSGVRSFEEDYQANGMLRKSRSKRATTHAEERKQKRRARHHPDGFREHRMSTSPLPGPIPQSTTGSLNVRTARLAVDNEDDMELVTTPEDHDMTDPLAAITQPASSAFLPDSSLLGGDMVQSPRLLPETSSLSQSSTSSREQPLMTSRLSGKPHLNFNYIYKQRRKLERNWANLKYKPFQLPHKDHPEEAHLEVIYTIQCAGRFLVSGSRDKTLRVWNLDTQRLVRKPLVGHTKSVLCLQFDASEEEDIIISGGSDTDVIIWKFSTGEIVKRLDRAHEESVLNLKFDHRYLVTCSKDNLIKVWNRKSLKPGDADYPQRDVSGGGNCPNYILDLTAFTSLYDMELKVKEEERQPLSPYNLIMNINHHTAAVNAVYIQGDRIASASGDRQVRLFDIHTGTCKALCIGHTKGVACVQYDGVRVISGSSDDTIRIFDPVSQAEVACLTGHHHLVRTVQASFSDVPGSRDTLEREALAVDKEFAEALRAGTVPENMRRSRRNRTGLNAGSRRPQDITAFGAKLPPGGGGNRWSRIVSGSYDETIIIWKKAPDGRWVVGHRLRQADALRAAGDPLPTHSERARHQHQHQHHVPQGILAVAPPGGGPMPQGPAVNAYPGQPLSAQQLMQAAMQSGAAAFQTGMQNLLAVNHQLASNPSIGARSTSRLPQLQQLAEYQVQQALMQQNRQLHHLQQHHRQQQQSIDHQRGQSSQSSSQNGGQSANGSGSSNHAGPSNQQQQPDQMPQQQQQQQQQFIPPPPPPAQVLPQQPGDLQQAGTINPPHNAAVQRPNAPQQQPPLPNAAMAHPNARVFKLQFDARRIISCSPDPKIVGWDFANGDEEIESVCAFFGEPT